MPNCQAKNRQGEDLKTVDARVRSNRSQPLPSRRIQQSTSAPHLNGFRGQQAFCCISQSEPNFRMEYFQCSQNSHLVPKWRDLGCMEQAIKFRACPTARRTCSVDLDQPGNQLRCRGHSHLFHVHAELRLCRRRGCGSPHVCEPE